MNPVLKALVPLAIVLPLAAFVVGSLVATDDEPPPRAPIVLTEVPTTGTAPTPRPSAVRPSPGEVEQDDEPGPRGTDTPPPPRRGDDARDDDDDDRDDDDRDDDD